MNSIRAVIAFALPVVATLAAQALTSATERLLPTVRCGAERKQVKR